MADEFMISAPDHVQMLHELRQTAAHLYSKSGAVLITVEPPARRCDAFDLLLRRGLVAKETYYAADGESPWSEYEAWAITKEGLELLSAYGR